MANIDRFSDDDLIELTPNDWGHDESGDDEETLIAEGDYGHDHTPTDESEDDDEAMETPYQPAQPEQQEQDLESEPEESEVTEPEPEPEESEQEEVAETETEAEEPAPVEENRIPIARLNKEITKRQALEERLQQMEQQLQQQTQQVEMQEVKVDQRSFADMQTAMLDGRADDASALFEGILKNVAATAASNAIAQSQQFAQQASQVSVAQSTQAELLQQTAYEMVQNYSILDDSSPDFDQQTLENVINLRDDLIQSGRFYPHVALEKAAQLVMMERGILPASMQPAPVEPPPPPPVKKVDVKAKVEKASRQPARLGGEPASGGEPRKLNISEMTDDEFDALSADELRRLRGDYI